MANVRNLKKDIDFLVSEIVSDCDLYICLHPKDNKKVEGAWSIIEKAIGMRNQLFARVNHPDGKNDKKLAKQHFLSIRKDLLENSHQLFESVSALSKK